MDKVNKLNYHLVHVPSVWLYALVRVFNRNRIERMNVCVIYIHNISSYIYGLLDWLSVFQGHPTMAVSRWKGQGSMCFSVHDAGGLSNPNPVLESQRISGELLIFCVGIVKK